MDRISILNEQAKHLGMIDFEWFIKLHMGSQVVADHNRKSLTNAYEYFLKSAGYMRSVNPDA